MKTVWFNLNGMGGDGRFGPLYERFGGRSWWVLRWSMMAAGLVFVIPFVALAIMAAGTFLLVFVALGLVDRALRWGRSVLGESDVRRNVTVVRVDDGGV